MADEKPMTVKERMALLARASSGNGTERSFSIANKSGSVGRSAGNSTATKTEAGSRPQKASVSERFAKLRRGSSSREGSGEARTSGGQAVSHVESSDPASAASELSPGLSPGLAAGEDSTGSSIAQRIAMLHFASSEQSTGTSSTSGNMKSASASSPSCAKSVTDSTAKKPSGMAECSRAPSIGQSASERRQVPASTSSGVLARAQVVNARMDKHKVEGAGGGVGVVASRIEGEKSLVPPPPPSASVSISTPTSTRMSPGLAARMQALRASPGSAGAEDPTSGGDVTGVTRSRGAEQVEKARSDVVGGTGLFGMGKAVPIPLPGVISPTDLSALKRRKDEVRRAANNATEASVERGGDPTDDVAGQPAGELRHENLSRATIPQRRRPRKGSRPFKTSTVATPINAHPGPLSQSTQNNGRTRKDSEEGRESAAMEGAWS